MCAEKITQLRAELRQMAKRDLYRMAFEQKENRCLLYGPCPFLLFYQGVRFCVSEILGKGCESGRLGLLSQDIDDSPERMEFSVGPWLPGFDG
jgi:hypothetical protein